MPAWDLFFFFFSFFFLLFFLVFILQYPQALRRRGSLINYLRLLRSRGTTSLEPAARHFPWRIDASSNLYPAEVSTTCRRCISFCFLMLCRKRDCP